MISAEHYITNNVSENIVKEAYSVKDFCKKYSISKATFYREVTSGRLSIHKCGRRTLVSRKDSDLWLMSLKCI